MYSVQSLFKDPKARLLTLIWLLQVQLEDDAAPPPGVPVPPPVDLDIPALTINRQGLLYSSARVDLKQCSRSRSDLWYYADPDPTIWKKDGSIYRELLTFPPGIFSWLNLD